VNSPFEIDAKTMSRSERINTGIPKTSNPLTDDSVNTTKGVTNSKLVPIIVKTKSFSFY